MNEHKKLFSKIGFNYLLLALLPILFQIILVNIIALWDVNFIKNINNQTVISSLTNYIIILPVFIYLMNKIESTKITETKLGIKKFLIYLCIALTLMWIGNIIGLVITQILGNAITNEIVNPIEELIQNSSIYINLIIILYLTTLVIVWSVGLYTIFTNYKNIEVNDEEREIYLEKPVKTVLLNLGMALFVIYHIFRILVSLSLIKI